MQVTRTMIDEAVTNGVLSDQQAPALWDFLINRKQETPSFKPAHILYYLGGLIAIGAMTLFMTLGWKRFGDSGLVLIASIYLLVALFLTEFFLARQRLTTPAGISATVAIIMVPLTLYGTLHLLGVWPPENPATVDFRDYAMRIYWSEVAMEFATLAAGAAALWRYRLTFMTMPIAVTLCYMTMSRTPYNPHGVLSDGTYLVLMYFGAAMTALAFLVDVRSRKSKDFAFWLYLVGVLAFWVGLSSMYSGSELSKFLYCFANLFMIVIGIALSRRVFAVSGGLGVAFYLGHLSHTIFKDSMLFPVALTAIGLGIIGIGVYWQRHEAAIGERLRARLPAVVQGLIPHRVC